VQHDTARDEAARASVRLSNLRAVTFLLAAGAWVTFDALAGPARIIVLALASTSTLAFGVMVWMHRRVRRRERWEGAVAALAKEGLLRLDRAWDALDEALPPAERAEADVPPEHAYAADLSVVGRASLVRLVGPVTSERGRAILRGWLLEPSDVAEARARQGAVRELSRLPGLRAHFTALGRLEGPDALKGLDRFMAWADGTGEAPADRPTGSLRVWSWTLPPVLVVGLVGYFAFGWLPWWIVPAAAQVYLLRRHRHAMGSAFAESELGGPPLRSLVPQLALLGPRQWRDRLLASVGARFGREDDAAVACLGRLSRLLDSVQSRRNVFYATVAPVLLLDVHLWAALDRWRAAHGASVRAWLEALGTWEALSALATLAHDHPDWALPELADEPEGLLQATGLGHPLLPPDQCVRNEVTVGPPGTFLFVTGSNMSGKSTLLRAIGCNAVLAAAGAPVCARSLALPPLQVHTSMRIEDSLAEGVSLFMAELLRIKGVVDAADAATAAGRPILYLLDEILHGTNTAERRIAARGVLRHLLRSGALGAVSSHDLALAESPELHAAAHAVHFREEVGRSEDGAASLSFDYRLREGVATTRNALKLLEAVGLGELALEGDPGDA